MDIFGTVVTSVDIIIKFLRASAAYSDDAESLLHRFNWDLRVMKRIIEYFEDIVEILFNLKMADRVDFKCVKPASLVCWSASNEHSINLKREKLYAEDDSIPQSQQKC
ncbi:hypothetical protein BO94DRAFT_587088 [Aspergillus sclerotioniger CBS 115572]|uniref:Fungal N-terminal domain-containing protein n=1 Tax=Aspergillus sclerotioniger CBS 115572 TaxID=1450535 RepID=A0A317W9Z7_9EURO|nr:hypothetical protein BO94DRAFT_587088 [Aspergillus sclerotioniger CBS 115572]PWY83193.1 hypothetical protein BO94DRAFT_587088 [Aspergillus sclerotioniger CBS 115572]